MPVHFSFSKNKVDMKKTFIYKLRTSSYRLIHTLLLNRKRTQSLGLAPTDLSDILSTPQKLPSRHLIVTLHLCAYLGFISIACMLHILKYYICVWDLGIINYLLLIKMVSSRVISLHLSICPFIHSFPPKARYDLYFIYLYINSLRFVKKIVA